LLFFDGCCEPCGEGESSEEEVGPFGVDLVERHGLEELGEGGEDGGAIGEVRQVEGGFGVLLWTALNVAAVEVAESLSGEGGRGAGVAVVPGVLAEVDGHGVLSLNA